MKKDNLSDQFQVNDEIRAREVRIVGDDIESKVVPLREALRIADEMELDLVLISPNAVPPVCRIVDFSKFIYQLKKKQKEAKAKQVKIDVKEIRFQVILLIPILFCFQEPLILPYCRISAVLNPI